MTRLQFFVLAFIFFSSALSGCSTEDKEPMTNAERQEIRRGLERYQSNNPSMRLTPAQNAAVAAEIEEKARK